MQAAVAEMRAPISCLLASVFVGEWRLTSMRVRLVMSKVGVETYQ